MKETSGSPARHRANDDVRQSLTRSPPHDVQGVPMPELPRGTVAFLFTDIEGSTALWEQDQDAMRRAVDRHLELLDAAIITHGGIHFKTVGDAVQAAFATAPDALAAAVDAQRAIAAEPWALPSPIRVRMAIHVGEADPDGAGDYHQAPALSRLGQLLSVAHGGQIVLSAAAQALVGDAPPSGVTLRELGEFRLRDLLEPERIWQVVAAGLPVDFPAPRTIEVLETNLPTQPTTLVGRETETARISALIEREGARLVTLTGPGGTGKTRLALAVAAEALDAFADGVWFVDLAPVADPAQVLPRIASVFGVRETGGPALLQSVAAFLSTKQVLLVLDNFEQVLDAVPDLVALLTASPRLSLLVTSREPLQVRAEQQVLVAPLALPPAASALPLAELARVPAIDLFVQRARAIVPDFALTEANAAAIAAICQRLDGLPLAIELAAARVRFLPPPALLERLERSLPVLTGGPRDAPARQRTLRDAIAWSHDLLEGDEPIVFRRLAVFSGGWTLDAAEAVVNPDGALDVFGVIAALADKSLVRPLPTPDPEPRFAMLETIREFGLDQLEIAGEVDATRRRHAEYFVAVAEALSADLFRATRPEVFARLAAELDNGRAALAWLDQQGDEEGLIRLAAALGWVWFIRGFGTEGIAWLERARAPHSAVAAPIRAAALNWASVNTLPRKDHAAAAELAALSAGLLRESGAKTAGLAMALLSQGRATGYSDHRAAGTVILEEALALARDLDHPLFVGAILDTLAEFAFLDGDLERATTLVTEALAVQRRHHPLWGTAFSLALLGELALARNDLPAAGAYYGESIELARAMGETTFLGAGMAAIGAIAAARGEAEQAALLLGAAEAMYQVAGAWSFIAARGQHRLAIEGARAALGEEAFAAAWAAGRRLSGEQATTEALQTAASLRVART
jgi:predicted ATPase/class 3 adenylate cyclase